MAVSERLRTSMGAAIVLVVGAVAGAVIMQWAQPAEPVALPAVTTEAVEPVTMLVDVQGAVREPGVYSLAEGARAIDAVARAGGLRDDAASDTLNLARVLMDGEQLRVPTTAEAEAAPADSTALGSGGGLVSINHADAAALETLPRVGPALAAAIIAYRDEHGPFSDVAELDNVSGIGPAVLAQLTPLVSL